MAIQTSRLVQILSGRSRGIIAGLLGLSIGGLICVASVYGNVGERMSPDAFACLTVLLLLVGWGIAAGLTVRSGRQAEKIAGILATPGMRMTFDRERNKLVIEQVEKVDLGFGAPTETVANRAEMTLEEAQLIGLELDTSRRRLLLSGSRVESNADHGPTVEVAATFSEPASPVSA